MISKPKDLALFAPNNKQYFMLFRGNIWLCSEADKKIKKSQKLPQTDAKTLQGSWLLFEEVLMLIAAFTIAMSMKMSGSKRKSKRLKSPPHRQKILEIRTKFMYDIPAVDVVWKTCNAMLRCPNDSITPFPSFIVHVYLLRISADADRSTAVLLPSSNKLKCIF